MTMPEVGLPYLVYLLHWVGPSARVWQSSLTLSMLHSMSIMQVTALVLRASGILVPIKKRIFRL